MRRLALLLALALLLPFALTGCGDDPAAEPDAFDQDTEQSESAEDQTAGGAQEEIPMVEGDAGVKVTGELGAKPVIELPGGEPPTELLYSDLVVGEGEQAPEGAQVSMHYVGVSWSNGQEFDASWDSGKTLDYPLTDLIVGWQRGVPGMKVGGRRLLVIPPDLGYGPNGYPPSIAPNETLVFVIDLMGVG